MVAGTAAAVGLTLVNDRRLTPVFVEASPAPPRPLNSSSVAAGTIDYPRSIFTRRLGIACLLASGCIIVAAAIPAMTALAVNLWASPASAQPSFGPPIEARAAAGVAGNWERSYSSAVPPAADIGAAVLAGMVEQNQRDFESALVALAADRDAKAAARARGLAIPRGLNRASGYPVGTILRGRITIYGCTGPGGGFCGNMASGIRVFEGAAACSSDLPMGTRIKIHGDPTGRVYECLDRGHLAAPWVDVFFYNTSEGIRWQGLLGGTITNIEIVN
jgi:hypothetical protein